MPTLQFIAPGCRLQNLGCHEILQTFLQQFEIFEFKKFRRRQFQNILHDYVFKIYVVAHFGLLHSIFSENSKILNLTAMMSRTKKKLQDTGLHNRKENKLKYLSKRFHSFSPQLLIFFYLVSFNFI